ncbi:bacterial Ig-like domain-containing protein [Enterococcus hirae]|uniref:bacterial Ig-like domain-containing protein n=1 Tax=Enterococcus hirae TaxID=1354 RepID=UPI001472E5AD|nr:bacterial Ig-like domain-containing protein [Enterococcus hirae]EMF0043325.1 bacterial Ig-like domain-containing protein [Enterococcus hirae]EMF0118651.1 bacterial Ig-like domain-containing protein [Enterococcus hirae]EMF0440828.1 bacterial Ig-like domain-containing protein [Enterococcus hirae]NME53367.1 BspA family leucine-rich repeat surface protein [Enterococcus hirae]
MNKKKLVKCSLAIWLATQSLLHPFSYSYAEEWSKPDEEQVQTATSLNEPGGKNDLVENPLETMIQEPDENQPELEESMTEVPQEELVEESESLDQPTESQSAVDLDQDQLTENTEQEETLLNTATPTEESTDIASGVFGTCSWRIDAEGTLYIGGGTLGETPVTFFLPWFNSYRFKIKKMVFTGPTIAPKETHRLFYGYSNLLSIENLAYLDVSQVTDMTSFFSDCRVLNGVDLSGWDTSNVTNMSNMFFEAFDQTENLIHLDLSSFDTSNVVDMSGMFSRCTKVQSIDLSSFDTSNVVNMNRMFFACNELITLDIAHFDTSNVVYMSRLFAECKKLRYVDVSNFDTSSAIDLSVMFRLNYELESVDVSNFDTSLVQAMRYMFANCELLETIDVSNFNTESVNYLTYMFLNCSKVKKLDLSYFQFEDPVEMAEMLAGTTSLNELTLGKGYRFVDSANLPAIPVEDGNTGYWQNVGSGTVTNPAGEYVLTSEELMTNYTGAMADTYVWQKEPNYESILAKDSTLYLGETWDPQDNFISATDKEGNPIPFDMSMVSGTVDTSVVGVTPITYTNGSAAQVIHVTVKENQESIQAKDSVIYVGDQWDPQANFVSATDEDGMPLAFTPKMVEGSVDSQKTGDYFVTYTNGIASKTIKVTVKENKETLVVKGSTLYVGDNWNPQDNFISANDKEGNPLIFDQKMVSGKVDTTKVGVYPVTYQNGHQKKTVEIHVLAEPTKEKPDADTNQSGDKKPVPATPNETTNNNDQRDKKDEKNEKNEKNKKDEKDEQEEQEEQEDKKLPTTGYQKSSLSMIGMACFLLGLYFVYKKKINVK